MSGAFPRHHCDEFSRSTLLRRAVAEAGQGLPAIEPGMPAPAGTGLDRLQFLSRTLGAALTVYGASALGPRVLDEGIARAAATGGAGRRVLVSVFAPGGWDALSLLSPIGDPRYRKLRSTLAFKPGDGPVFSSDGRLHWHPALAPLARLHARGRLTVFPAIGYAHPDQSHFTSRHFWEVGALDPQSGTGWLGRLLDVVGDNENAMQGLSLDGALLPSLATARVPVATLSSPADYGFDSHNVWDVPGELLEEAIGSLGATSADPDPVLALAGKTIEQSHALHRQLGRFVGKDGQVHISPKAKYPETDFGRRLSGLAALLDANFPIRAAALTGPGSYDTHADQQGPLQDGATQIAEGLAAFQADLERRGVAGRVLTLVWSEFGRRAQQNESNGTDHGAAGVAFLMGTKVRQRMVGEFPGLTKGLDGDGNLKATVDFRSVYASLAEQWFDVDAARVLPDARSMPRPRLVA
jgi:uncharacterized protein (DUF1501 family)